MSGGRTAAHRAVSRRDPPGILRAATTNRIGERVAQHRTGFG